MGDRGVLAEGSALCRGPACSQVHSLALSKTHRVQGLCMLGSGHWADDISYERLCVFTRVYSWELTTSLQCKGGWKGT